MMFQTCFRLVSFSTGVLIRIDWLHLIALLILFGDFGRSNVMGMRPADNPPRKSPNLEPGLSVGKGSIDLGGLIVSQISTVNRVWETYEGGPNDQGATFYEPWALPDGYFLLGHYIHDNKQTIHGRVLAVRDDSNGAVAKPVSYNLLWSSEKSKMKQMNGVGYVWQPVPPKGYMALGHIVTTTPEMPSLDKVRCVRSDFVEECSDGDWIWGEGENGINLFEGKSENSVGIATTRSVPVGTFKAAVSGKSDTSLVYCLKNSNAVNLSMPNMDQIKQLMATYGPLLYFHPDENYFPASMDWFFDEGALLYQRGNEAKPVRIDLTGSNLPQGGSNDGAFWLDLPVDGNAKEKVMKGDLRSAKAYLHVKPLQGGTVTDLAIWLFYPYNGPATVKFLSFNIHLGRIGSHVGDWEHITLRINNLDGKLQSVFFGQHSGGQRVSPSELEYDKGNKPIAYSSRNGHATYPHGGLVLQGNKRIGVRNDMAKSNNFLDIGANFEIISAEYLGIVEPPWINYFRQWGPKINYNVQDELKAVEKVLIFKSLKREFEKFVNGLPDEVLGQEGPLGPKMKASWNGDE